MLRKIIKIDEEKCDGCTLCVTACHEGAIGMVHGKAKLLRDDYCDGLGNCLPVCPTGAISFEEREAEEFNEAEVKKALAGKMTEDLPCGCPGTNTKTFNREKSLAAGDTERSQSARSFQGISKKTGDRLGIKADESATNNSLALESQLNQWPIQIKLVPQNAPYFKNANLLIAADCSAYSHGDFHNTFMKNRITLIGCPKLDEGDYSVKLTEILRNNEINSVLVVRMEVPCCGGIENAVKIALKNCGKLIQWQVVTLSTDGNIL